MSNKLSVGIVGLPNVGKSTLFNALLKKRVALSANYPFATIESNVGVVAVPDERLTKLAELMAKSTSEESRPTSEVLVMPPIVPTVVEFVDIAGLVKGAHKGEGLGNQFLSHIREVDAVVHVLRDFQDENVVRVGALNPKFDKEIVETELILADLQTIDKLINNAETEAKSGTMPSYSNQLFPVLKQIKRLLEQGKLAKEVEEKDERVKQLLYKLPLLTIKPVLYVYNGEEQGYNESLERSDVTKDKLTICAKLEEELADLSEQDGKEYLQEMGIAETGLERLIKSTYQILDLISFLTTTGKKEVRAWTIKKGTKAPQAAGIIHTDFEKGFIRAQVIEYDKLMEAGSYTEAKLKGWIRTEGKDYVVGDGDVIEFLVST